MLFNLLLIFKNASVQHPVITANAIMAKLDFEKIKKSNFNKYHFDPFTETLKHYRA